MSDTPNTATHGAASAAPFFSTTPRNTMKFDTHNTTPGIHHNANGTSPQGHITATYKELTDLFGEPTSGDGYKVDAEWYLLFEDGTFATIYNWKNGKSYCGEDGLNVEQIEDWHVGGMSKASAERVQIAIDLDREVREAEKPKNKFDEAFCSAVEIMQTLKATRGENYAKAVEVALMVRKQGELVAMLTDVVAKATDMPEPVATMLRETHNVMSAKILARFMRVAVPDIADMQDTAEEVMGWVDRVMDAEKDGVGNLLKGAGK